MANRVIPVTSLLPFLRTEDVRPFPFLESFAREYSQKVSEDKKTPLFSKTSKYNSFPVRCHFKSSDKRDRDPHKRRTPARTEHKGGLPDGTPQNEDSTWRRDTASSIAPTRLKKADGLKSSVIKVLNKITEENFDKQADDLLKVLSESKDPRAVKVIAEIILEKVWYDKSFYGIYVALCQKLWASDEWTSHAYKVFRSSNDQFFYVLQIEPPKTQGATPDLNGPFSTQEEAEVAAKQRVHLRTVFLALCRDHFYRREEYITKARTMEDGNPRYKTRRKLFGTVEIVGQFYKMGYLDERVIHFIFLSLLHSDHNHQNGAKFEEEIEAFHLLWNVIKNKIPIGTFKEYRPLLDREKKKEKNPWSSRILFMLDDMLEFSGSRFLGKRLVLPTKKLREPETPKILRRLAQKSVNSNNTRSRSVITPKPSTPIEARGGVSRREAVSSERPDGAKRSIRPSHPRSPVETKEQIVEKLTKMSRKLDATNSVMERVCALKNGERSQMLVEIATSLIRDSAEYGEHVNSHLRTLLNLLKNKASHFRFDQLSEAFSVACEDIGDIKIDAPKAPNNMSVLLGGILKEISSGDCADADSVLQISVTPSADCPQEEVENFEREQMEEWRNILKLSTSIVPVDTLDARVNLFSMSGTTV